MAIYTELSVTATPGAVHSFTAKTPASENEHIGQFTELSIIALPGGRHVFLPKELIEPTPPVPSIEYHGGGGIYIKEREYEKRLELKEVIRQDDNEVYEMLSVIMPVLN